MTMEVTIVALAPAPSAAHSLADGAETERPGQGEPPLASARCPRMPDGISALK